MKIETEQIYKIVKKYGGVLTDDRHFMDDVDKLLETAHNANTLLYEVYLCIVETEKRIMTIVSKNKELSQEEKNIIERQYGKIYCISNNVGSDVGVLLISANSDYAKSCDFCTDKSEAEFNICQPCLDRLISEGN